MPEDKKENVIDVDVTFRMKVLIRGDKNIDELLEKETSFLAEPNSVNGCVLKMNLKDIKKI